jgi:hypothetical protein
MVLLVFGSAACVSSSRPTAVERAVATANADGPAAPSDSNGIEAEGLCVQWLGHDDSNFASPLLFSMQNLISKPVYVLAYYSLSDPASRIMVENTGTWSDATRMRGCGVGIRWIALQEYEVAKFQVFVDQSQNLDLSPMKVGVRYRMMGGDIDHPESWLTAWSPAFVPDHLFDEAAFLKSRSKSAKTETH